MHLLMKTADIEHFSHSVPNILLLRLTLRALGIKLSDYWKALTDKRSRGQAFQGGGKSESEEESASEK